jgi:molecular chaperone GrpE (heat shock protein)
MNYTLVQTKEQKEFLSESDEQEGKKNPKAGEIYYTGKGHFSSIGQLAKELTEIRIKESEIEEILKLNEDIENFTKGLKRDLDKAFKEAVKNNELLESEIKRLTGIIEAEEFAQEVYKVYLKGFKDSEEVPLSREEFENHLCESEGN